MSGIENKSRVNFNLSHQMLLEAAKDFEGYLTGLSNNNIVEFFGNEEQIKKIKEAKEDESKKDLKIIKDELIPNILDRTTGCFLTKDLFYLNNNIIRNINIPKSLNKYINIVYGPKQIPETSGQDNITYFQETMPISSTVVDNKLSLTTNDAIKNVMFNKISTSVLTKEDSDGQEVEVLEDPSDPFSEPKEYYSGIMYSADSKEASSKVISDGYLNIDLEPSRYTSPHMASYVIKEHSISINRKNVNHLPIFFNAIPPIEMSRCVPYLDIKVVSRKFENDSGISNIKNFRFVDADNNFDDQVGFNNLTLVNDDFKEFSENRNISLMDVFTSPQTMVNADINSGNYGKDLYENVLDPIMPLMTLESLEVKISGKGYGMMASKVADMSIVLHDRSRLSEIAPLVASNQIAGTKIIIEYGWNHPEGSVDSENIIGKYLNALKDMSIYQVVKADYSFQGPSVKINIRLAASGFKKSERVHIGAGPVVPGNVLEEIIDEAVNEALRENKEREVSKIKIKEVRQKIRLNGSNSRDVYSNFTWDQYKKVVKKLGNVESSESVKNEIKKIISGEETSDGEFSNLLNTDEFEKKGTMIGNVYAKLEYFNSGEFRDPFVYCYVNESKNSIDRSLAKDEAHNVQREKYREKIIEDNSRDGSNSSTDDKFVTLGSVLNTFVGYPMASTCLFDEVQMVFHPVNHQAGAARQYTLANFPIELKKLREVIENTIKKNSRLTINAFLNILEREIIRDRNSYAYGLNPEYRALSDLSEKKDDKDKVNAIINIIENGNGSSLGFDANNDADDKRFLEIINEISPWGGAEVEVPSQKLTSGKSFKKRALELYKKDRSTKISKKRTDIEERLESIYKSDGLTKLYPAKNHLTVPNITLDYEVLPAIVGTSSDDYQELGVSLEKSVLRINVYDQESVASPADLALISSKIGGIDNQFSKDIKDIADSMTFSEVKDTIKRTYPTINYGSSTGTVNSISSNANSNGKLANVLMVESYKNIATADTVGKSFSIPYEDITMFPNTVSVECAGMPMLGRGNNIFIDFGTNTTLDNIYTVRDLSHSIRQGSFTTKITLVPSNIKSVSSFRGKLQKI